MGCLLAAIAASLLALGAAAPAVANDPALGPNPLRDDPSRGIVDLGLDRADPGGPCRGQGFELRAADGSTACTHGPDPAPAGIDVRRPRTLAQLRADLAVAEGDAGGQTQSTSGSSSVPCVGFGTSGPRVTAVYASVEGTPSRYGQVAPLIRGWAKVADDIFDASAAQTGGSRHVRWEHDRDCNVTVRSVVLTDAAVFNLGTMMDELDALGLNRADRRYLVWFDVDLICGVAVNITDDRPGQDNRNNGAPTGLVHFGRVDRGCWGVTAPDNLVEAHEIMHTLGAVQYSSPNSSSVSINEIYGHCTDEYETMCYDDGTPKPIRQRCPISNERFFDCGNDDYFHTRPPAGSYLATHWNSAMSRFLTRVDPVAGFLDVSGSIFAGDIAWIASAGITSGCSGDGERYCAEQAVTREQMASFLARALGLPPATRDFFTDDGSSIHQADINRVAQAGVATGCGGGRFCPRQTVTREQMASFLTRALALPPATRDFFTDDERSIHEADINRVAQAGVTSGCATNRYCPSTAVTRGQMAAFLRRAFG